MAPPGAVQRNYRTFLLFIYGTSVYIAWTFVVSIGSLFVRHSELVRQQQQIAVAALDQGGSGNLWLTTLSEWLEEEEEGHGDIGEGRGGDEGSAGHSWVPDEWLLVNDPWICA